MKQNGHDKTGKGSPKIDGAEKLKDAKIRYPWDNKGVSPLAKILAMLGVLTLLCVAFNAAIGPVTAISVAISDPTQLFALESLVSLLVFSLLIPLGIIGLCVFGLIKIWRLVVTPGSFKPRTGQIAPGELGKQFDVRFATQLVSRSFRGKGMVRFIDEAIELDGTLPPSIWLQLGVIAVVTLVPLFLFGVGLGLIPALILAAMIGKEDRSRYIPHNSLLKLSVKGHTVAIVARGDIPNKFKFTVAASDSERLYRELYTHCPEAVAEWQDQLQKMAGSAGQPEPAA